MIPWLKRHGSVWGGNSLLLVLHWEVLFRFQWQVEFVIARLSFFVSVNIIKKWNNKAAQFWCFDWLFWRLFKCSRHMFSSAWCICSESRNAQMEIEFHSRTRDTSIYPTSVFIFLFHVSGLLRENEIRAIVYVMVCESGEIGIIVNLYLSHIWQSESVSQNK